jgi:hypothetical protein
MRKAPFLGLAGLLMVGALGCETNRPYCTKCMVARNNYGQAETAYRPRTTVTMRADEVPENPPAVQVCPTVQVVGAAGNSVTQAASQTAPSTPMVTVTIPSIKITVPMTAVVGNSQTASSEPAKVNQLPPAAVSVIHADAKTTSPAPLLNLPSPESSIQSGIRVQKEETSHAKPAKPAKAEETPTSELPPEPKPMSKASESKSDVDRLPRLSLLPPEPPPEVPGHRTSSASPSRNSLIEMPPPPPPVPKSGSPGGPSIPPEDSE